MAQPCQSLRVMAGLDPATPIMWHGRAFAIGIAGSSPAMTAGGFVVENILSKRAGTALRALPTPRHGRPHPSGSGMNSVSPGTGPKRPDFQSSFADSIRSRRDDTKFHQM
jgi:hypothetical protein